jgi:hypothetical protein
MSLATLKRKTQTKYKNMSVGQAQFSLNGTHRNQGFVGQTSLSRTILKSPYNGTAPRGHGGLQGTYTISNIKNSTINNLNDNDVVKSSSLGTNGMIMSKYRWIRRPQPYSTVKPDNNNNTSTQGQYIEKQAQATQQSVRDETCVQGTYESTCGNATAGCVITKDASTYTSTSASEYLSKLKDQCVDNDETSSSSISQMPVGCGV